jgi:hypothetical protein
LPPGIDWDSFLLRFPERDIAFLPSLLEPHIGSSLRRGAAARKAYEAAFSQEVEFDRIIECAAQTLRHGGMLESQFRKRHWKMIRRFNFRYKARQRLRAVAKVVLRLPGLRRFYKLNS